MNENNSGRISILSSIGPAIIVASVVIGPGSILTNSKVGWQFGYDMVWVLVVACLLMIGMTALSTRLGVHLQGTLCQELAERAGRPLAILAGGTLFLIAACFQFGNNLGVLFSLEPFLSDPDESQVQIWPAVVLVGINGGLIAVLLGVKRLYKLLERLMKLLVALMVIGFAANLFLAKPSVGDIVKGIVPSLPSSEQGGFGQSLLTIIGMFGTTFSVGAAFYQSYLVRQKGWTKDHLRQGFADSVIGITVLGLMSLMIMVTAASVLHGNPDVVSLQNAGDVARQLRPLFGPWATGLFCMGIFAGAFSSFLVNAMIGGTVLSDGFGKGGSMDDRFPKMCTIFALLMGMVIALAIKFLEFNTGNLIVFAQALTVLGNPLLAGAMLWLATRRDLNDQKAVPLWIKCLAGAGFLVVLGLSVRTVLRLAGA